MDGLLTPRHGSGHGNRTRLEGLMKPLSSPEDQAASKWRRVRGSNPQGRETRLFSRQVPSPSFGLTLREMVSAAGIAPALSRLRTG